MNESPQEQLKLFHFDDLCADLAYEIESKGARYMLSEFELRYPKHYHELKVQMNREQKQVAVLLVNSQKEPK